jgi:hypothetical protein
MAINFTTRTALVSTASVAGMFAGAAGALLVAMAVGLGGELTVLCMLAAELAACLAVGHHVDRRIDAWLEARAQARLARGVPRARVHGAGLRGLRGCSPGARLLGPAPDAGPARSKS